MTFSLSLHKIRALLQTQNERRVIFFPSLPLPPSFFELPLKRILRKPANFFPESNQLFVGHLAQFIPQLP